MHNQCFYTQFTAITSAQRFCKGFASKLTLLWQQSVFKSNLPATAVCVPVPKNYFLAWLYLPGGDSFLLYSDRKYFSPSPALWDVKCQLPITHWKDLVYMLSLGRQCFKTLPLKIFLPPQLQATWILSACWNIFLRHWKCPSNVN